MSFNYKIGEDYRRLLFGWRRQDKKYKLIDRSFEFYKAKSTITG